MTVGIDGGYVRAAHKQGNFEVIAGRSVVAFQKETHPARYRDYRWHRMQGRAATTRLQTGKRVRRAG